MKKRILAAALSMMLCLCLLAVGLAEEIPEIKLTGKVNQYGWEVPEETIKFAIYGADDDATNQAEEDSRLQVVDKVLKDEFNVEIEKYVYSQDATERLNFMLAANDYPDVLVGIDDAMANQFIAQGRAVELTPYLEKYGQRVLASYGGFINLLREEDGSLYKLSSCLGNTTDLMGRAFAIRYDWMKEAGIEEMPSSFESYYEDIKACVAAHPVNDKGEKVYAISSFTLKGEDFYQVPLLYKGFYAAPTGCYKMNDDGTISYWVDTEEGRWVAHYINRFWQDGLIDPDFQTKDSETSRAFMAGDRVAGNIGSWWDCVYSQQVWDTTEPDFDVYAKHFQAVSWEEDGAIPNLIGNNFIRSRRVIITDKCKNPEQVVKYMDWQTTPAGVAFVAFGPCGEDMGWHFTEDGLIEMNPYYWAGNPDDPSFLWNDFKTKTCGGWNYQIAAPGYTPENRKDNPAEGWAAPAQAVNVWDVVADYLALDPATLSADNSMYVINNTTYKPYLYDLTNWNVTIDPDSDLATIQEDIKDKVITDWCYCVMAEDDAACDAALDKMVDDLHSLGLDELVAAQQESLQKNQEKVNGTYWNK